MQISTSKVKRRPFTLSLSFEETIKSPLTRKRELCANVHLRLRIFCYGSRTSQMSFFYCSAPATAAAFF
jgi:hypothetical protein